VPDEAGAGESDRCSVLGLRSRSAASALEAPLWIVRGGGQSYASRLMRASSRVTAASRGSRSRATVAATMLCSVSK
jgi:hypothetical protein